MCRYIDVTTLHIAPQAIDVLPLLLRALELMARWRPPNAKVARGAGTAAAGGGAAAAAGDSPAVPLDADDAQIDTLATEQEMVRLVCFMLYRQHAVQERVRSLDGIVPLLQRCQYDDGNPQMREWALMAVRNLCEGNEGNQAFIEQIERKPRGVAQTDVLDGTGLEVEVDPETGRLRPKRT